MSRIEEGVVRLVTNDFKITRSLDHGIIHNYSVDFLPGKIVQSGLSEQALQERN